MTKRGAFFANTPFDEKGCLGLANTPFEERPPATPETGCFGLANTPFDARPSGSGKDSPPATEDDRCGDELRTARNEATPKSKPRADIATRVRAARCARARWPEMVKSELMEMTTKQLLQLEAVAAKEIRAKLEQESAQLEEHDEQE